MLTEPSLQTTTNASSAQNSSGVSNSAESVTPTSSLASMIKVGCASSEIGSKISKIMLALFLCFLLSACSPSDVNRVDCLRNKMVLCATRYHHWSRCCVKISRGALRLGRTTESLATDRLWRHHPITQEYAIVQIPWLSRLNQLRRPPQTERLRRPALTPTPSCSDRTRRRETYSAPTVASSFPIRHSTSCTRDVTASRIPGSATFAPRHAQMSTNSIRICWVRVINEDVITIRQLGSLNLAKFYFYITPRWRKLNMGIFMCDWPKWDLNDKT